jgi:hypothetical protein
MSAPQPDIQQQIQQQLESSTVYLFGHAFNVYAMLIGLMFAMFLFMIYKAHKADKLDWTDMIANNGTVSTTKVLQLIGGFTGTFVVVKLAMAAALNWDMFSIYLAYVASIDGYSKFIGAKYGLTTPPSGSPAAAALVPPPVVPAPTAPIAPMAPPPAPPAPPAPTAPTITVTVNDLAQSGSAKVPDDDAS